jgi:hypothetical protein
MRRCPVEVDLQPRRYLADTHVDFEKRRQLFHVDLRFLTSRHHLHRSQNASAFLKDVVECQVNRVGPHSHLNGMLMEGQVSPLLNSGLILVAEQLGRVVHSVEVNVGLQVAPEVAMEVEESVALLQAELEEVVILGGGSGQRLLMVCICLDGNQ